MADANVLVRFNEFDGNDWMNSTTRFPFTINISPEARAEKEIKLVDESHKKPHQFCIFWLWPANSSLVGLFRERSFYIQFDVSHVHHIQSFLLSAQTQHASIPRIRSSISIPIELGFYAILLIWSATNGRTKRTVFIDCWNVVVLARAHCWQCGCVARSCRALKTLIISGISQAQCRLPGQSTRRSHIFSTSYLPRAMRLIKNLQAEKKNSDGMILITAYHGFIA